MHITVTSLPNDWAGDECKVSSTRVWTGEDKTKTHQISFGKIAHQKGTEISSATNIQARVDDW